MNVKSGHWLPLCVDDIIILKRGVFQGVTLNRIKTLNGLFYFFEWKMPSTRTGYGEEVMVYKVKAFFQNQMQKCISFLFKIFIHCLWKNNDRIIFFWVFTYECVFLIIFNESTEFIQLWVHTQVSDIFSLAVLSKNKKVYIVYHRCGQVLIVVVIWEQNVMVGCNSQVLATAGSALDIC